jgi:hypothetical protein
MTSPFHEQLLLFFQEDLRKKEEEGWDARIDSELRSFSDDVSRALREGTLFSLEGLIARRQYLLQTRPIHLELKLFQLFPDSLMRRLRLSPLQVIRGIPRFYKKTEPTLAKLDPAQPLLQLKKNIALRALCELYEQVPIPKNAHVTLVGEPRLAALAKDILQEHVPYLTVELFTSTQESDLVLQMDHQFGTESEQHTFGFHFLERGILLPQLIAAEPDTNFFYADLRTAVGLTLYLSALLRWRANDTRDLTVYVGNRNALIETMKHLPSVPGVGRWVVELGSRVAVMKQNEEGKTVRCISPDLPSSLQTLIAQSANFIGCGSDAALSVALAQNKIFFYDGPMGKDLLALAENRLPADRDLNRLLRLYLHNQGAHEDHEWIDEFVVQGETSLEHDQIASEIAVLLCNENLPYVFQKMCTIVKERYNGNSFLCQFIQRAVAHRRRPKLAQKEQELLAQFLQDQLSFVNFIEAMRDVLF